MIKKALQWNVSVVAAVMDRGQLRAPANQLLEADLNCRGSQHVRNFRLA
jgi:hypothetical protein